MYYALISAACAGGAFFAGMMYERASWNDLIQRGILPKPKKLK